MARKDIRTIQKVQRSQSDITTASPKTVPRRTAGPKAIRVRSNSEITPPQQLTNNVVIEEIAPVIKTCKYLRGSKPVTRLPHNAASLTPIINDPLTAPLSNLCDDYNNFGGGVNPLGYKGHTFTANGYGPVYIHRPQSEPLQTVRSRDRPNIFDLLDKLEDDDYMGNNNNENHRDNGHRSLENENEAEQSENRRDRRMGGTNQSVHNSSQESEQDRSIMGPASPFCVASTLSELGESSVLGPNWYIVWRVFYLMTCLISTMLSIYTTKGGPWLSGTIAITYVALSGLIAFRRCIQFRLFRSQDEPEIVHDLMPYSWFDVVLRQGTPVICAVIGMGLPGMLSAVLAWRGIVVTYYRAVVFYLTAVVTLLSLIDIWLGAIPVRSTYIFIIVVICGIITTIVAWGFRVVVFWSLVMITVAFATLIALLFHIIARLIFLQTSPRRASIVDEGTRNSTERFDAV